MAGGLQLRHILGMMGVAGFMQLASIPASPSMLRHRLGTGAKGVGVTISAMSRSRIMRESTARNYG
jgi:hypothetical protein